MRETMADVKDGMSVAERRRKLLAEGALLRLGVMESRATVRENLNAESLAKSAMRRVLGTVSATVGGLFSGKGAGLNLQSLQSLQSLSPLLIGGISLLSRRALRKPLFYGGIISIGAAAAYYLTRQRPVAETADDVEATLPEAE
jgi:hypothetical protein